MRWEDERYVRLYTRDTPEWMAMTWEARALFALLLRKVDRAGLLELGRAGLRGLAAVLSIPLETVERALPELVEDGCVVRQGTTLLVPNFIEAQESKQTDAARKREQRGRDRDKVRLSGQHLNPSGQDITAEFGRRVSASVTDGHAESQPVTHEVTRGHAESHEVTPSCAVPCLPVPTRADPILAAAPSDAPRQEPLLEGAKGKKPDPRHKPLTDELCQVFEGEVGAKYGYAGGKDAKAVTRLLALAGEAGPPEVVRRWRQGLRATGFDRCATFHDLAEKWNRLPGADPPKARDWKRGRVGAEEFAHEKTGDLTHEF